MSEKRFTFADGFKIVAIKDNDKIMNSKQVCNKLNELNDENNKLKNSLELSDVAYHEMIKSNKELHKELYQEFKKVKKENKKLKEKNKLIFEQIIAFKKECVKDIDFEGSRTIYRLLSYLKDLKNGD
jgi:DNA repair exonuclease SbcCD ATPase subunit